MVTSIEPLAREDGRGRSSLLDPTREHEAHRTGLLAACQRVFGRMHRQRTWLAPFGEPPPLANAERAAAEMLSLPVHPAPTDAEVERVAGAVAGFFRR